MHIEVSIFDTFMGFKQGDAMATSLDLVTALKAELKRSGLTYAHLAERLGMAESSIKRIFAKGDMPLSRIDEICRGSSWISPNWPAAWPRASRCVASSRWRRRRPWWPTASCC
jgi:hypothetical protein